MTVHGRVAFAFCSILLHLFSPVAPPTLGGATRLIRETDNNPNPISSYRSTRTSFNGGIDLITIFTQSQSGEETPSLALLNDTLGDDDAANGQLRYIWAFSYVDHAIHDNNDESHIVYELRKMDRLIGEVYSAIEESGTVDRTILAVVSDHGMTFDHNGRYSHGINLVSHLTTREFGAHHVLTRSGTRATYTLNNSALKPWPVISHVDASHESFYLADRPNQATCGLDNDGNQRVQIILRSPDLNRIQILLQALRKETTTRETRSLLADAVVTIVERNRAFWQRDFDSVGIELTALRAMRERYELEVERLSPTIAYHRRRRRDARTPTSSEAELLPYGGRSRLNAKDWLLDSDQYRQELGVRISQIEKHVKDYSAYRRRLESRLALRTRDDVVASRDAGLFGEVEFGRRLKAADLLRYPIGLRGIHVDAYGRLDETASFETVDYIELFGSIRIRNTVYPSYSVDPVHCVVTRLDASVFQDIAKRKRLVSPDRVADVEDAPLVMNGRSRGLVLYTVDSAGEERFGLLPISDLSISEAGEIDFDKCDWRPGLPFRLVEDPDLETGGEDAELWLSESHSDREWLEATHRSSQGLAVLGLVEVFSLDYERMFAERLESSHDDVERAVIGFELRRRRAKETDLFAMANANWHFNVKDFNPGGNHGGFNRESMHTIFWLQGGRGTRVRSGPVVIERPYDGLAVAPTLLELAGKTNESNFTSDLVNGGFRAFPGSIAVEALAGSGTP